VRPPARPRQRRAAIRRIYADNSENRVYFFSHDRGEPPHVHVDRDANTAKFWLAPVALAYNIGFRAKELRDIQHIVNEHAVAFLEAWHVNFPT
jgi:hypothetical protein